MTWELLIYGSTILICIGIVLVYVRSGAKKSQEVRQKVEKAKEEGRFQPISLHPHINLDSCIGSGACVRACPEEDILGLIDGKATVINAASCIGHGACFHACPVDAITLRIGTEERGVELPHVKPDYETNVPGIYIAGELGGMGLIRNSAEQGIQAVENIAKELNAKQQTDCDLVIIGAGPAGLAGSLKAKELGLKFRTLEQDSVGGTVYTFPRSKVVMTQPMNLPLYGKLKLVNTSKDELLTIWNEALGKNDITIDEGMKVERIVQSDDSCFRVEVANGISISTQKVLIAIGRRGTPRKLGVPGEESQKVAYRMLEPEQIENEKILVVGGGDSAVESALLVCDKNETILSYRKENFARIKPGNQQALDKAVEDGRIKLMLSSNVKEIRSATVIIQDSTKTEVEIENNRVYIFIGGELPIPFLKDAGIDVQTTFGKVLKKHKR